VFGDSLVDAGNALKLAKWYGGLPLTDLPEGAPTASLGYFLGRFSDGYVFTDLISNKAIGLVTKPVFPFGYEDPVFGLPIDPFAGDPNGNNLNFAYGGAHVIQGDELVPELDAQTDAFRDAVDGDAPPGALYLFTFGGNDVRDLAPTASDPVPSLLAHAQLQEIADDLAWEIGQLIDDGARNIVITGLPDVGLIPKYDRDGNGTLDATELMRSEAATEYSIYLDMLIRTQVIPALQQELAERGLDPNGIVYIPIMDHVDASGEVVAGALNASLGTLAALHNVTPPTDFDGTPAEYLASQLRSHSLEYRSLVFFDGVHPNAQAHALLASYMDSLISGTEWVETMPLLGADVDYRTTVTIGAVGEVDRSSFAMVAGTTYTFQMLGVSTVTPFVLDQLDIASLGGVVLADPSLRLLSSAGVVVQSDDDSGIGLDSSLSFSAAAAGTYTLEASAFGSLTGAYVLTATVTGAAMQAGNTYTVNSASTLVLEGAGGVGQDVVKASASYALAAGSEIEVLRTTNDHGKAAINLTGNEFDQAIIGNNGANVLEGMGGADVMTGGGGSDRFVLSSAPLTDPDSIDSITDYGRGDVVDIAQILSVAAGTDVISGGYVRVTTSGLIQVDLNGGGNNWATLSTINGNGAVTVRYLSGGVAANVSVARVNDPFATIAASTGAVLAGAVAAAGLAAAPLAAEGHPTFEETHSAPAGAAAIGAGPAANAVEQGWHGRLVLPDETHDLGADGSRAPGDGPVAAMNFAAGPDSGQLAGAVVAQEPLFGPPAGTDAPGQADAGAIAAHGIMMPTAEAMQAAAATTLAGNSDEPKTTGEVARVLADALSEGVGDHDIDALLGSTPATGHDPQVALTDLAGQGAWTTVSTAFVGGHDAFASEMLSLHQDAAAAT
jgi:phospholipase/lecithinase/hemolysin